MIDFNCNIYRPAAGLFSALTYYMDELWHWFMPWLAMRLVHVYPTRLIFVRGEDILSEGQRLHSAREVEKRLKEANIDPKGMQDYINAFRWGTLPLHAGGGIGKSFYSISFSFALWDEILIIYDLGLQSDSSCSSSNSVICTMPPSSLPHNPKSFSLEFHMNT